MLNPAPDADRQRLLDAVIALAHEAGAAILAVYARADFGARDKADGTPVTEADLAAHHLLEPGLAALLPDVPVVSEEGAAAVPKSSLADAGPGDASDSAAPGSGAKAPPRYWLVDPLDGTREFLARNGEFCVNVALVEGGVPVLGVVHAPALGETWTALRGVGAWKLAGGSGERAGGSLGADTRADGGDRVGVDARVALAVQPRSDTPRLLLSRSHREPALERIRAALGPTEAHGVGAAIKFCRIAEGAADAYPKLGRIAEWDTAAGQCVLEAAGGSVLALPALTSLRYGTLADWKVPAFVALSRRLEEPVPTLGPADVPADWAMHLSRLLADAAAGHEHAATAPGAPTPPATAADKASS